MKKKTTDEMKREKNKGKSISMYIKKLRGETMMKASEIVLHDATGHKLEENNRGRIANILENHISKTRK